MQNVLTKAEQRALDRQIELQLTIEEVRRTNELHKLDSFFYKNYQASTSFGFHTDYDPRAIIKYAGKPKMLAEPAVFHCETIENDVIKIDFFYHDSYGKPIEHRTSFWKEFDGEFKQIGHYLHELKSSDS